MHEGPAAWLYTSTGWSVTCSVEHCQTTVEGIKSAKVSPEVEGVRSPETPYKRLVEESDLLCDKPFQRLDDRPVGP
jgi:hypothetical protein